MTRSEKENFSAFMAAVFSPPDETLLADLHQGQGDFLLGGEVSLSALRNEYARLFSNGGGRRVSLVESTYKPWSQDPDCALAFSSQKGLLMADCALHLQKVFQELSFEVPRGFQGMPDHLALELELLSYLYRFASADQIRRFIEDHLDWIPELNRQIQQVDSGSFYRIAVERLNDFLRAEKHPRMEEKIDHLQFR